MPASDSHQRLADLGAIIVIAVFYTDHIEPLSLGLALAGVAGFALVARLRQAGLLAHPELGTWLRSIVEAAERRS